MDPSPPPAPPDAPPAAVDPAALPADAGPPPPPPPFRKSGLLFFVVILLLYLPGMVAQALNRPVGLAWTELCGLLLPSLVATAGANLRVRRYLGLQAPARPAMLLALPLGVAGFVVAQGVAAVWIRFIPAGWVERWDVSQIFETSTVQQVAVVVAAVVLAPLCEETAFRGYLQRTLAIRRGPAAGVGLAAFLFALLHVNPVLFPSLLVLGLLYGWLAWRSGSTWPSMVAHATNNGLASGLALLVPGLGEAPPGAPPPPLAGALIWLLLGTTGVLALGAMLARRLPPPAPPAEAVALRDPTDPDLAFRTRRVPPVLLLCIALALAVLSGLSFSAALRHG